MYKIDNTELEKIKSIVAAGNPSGDGFLIIAENRTEVDELLKAIPEAKVVNSNTMLQVSDEIKVHPFILNCEGAFTQGWNTPKNTMVITTSRALKSRHIDAAQGRSYSFRTGNTVQVNYSSIADKLEEIKVPDFDTVGYLDREFKNHVEKVYVKASKVIGRPTTLTLSPLNIFNELAIKYLNENSDIRIIPVGDTSLADRKEYNVRRK